MTPTATSFPALLDPYGEEPIRAEVYGLESLEAHARELAALPAEPVPPTGRSLLHRVRENGQFLHQTHRLLAEASRRQEPMTPDAEWLLDNFYIIDDVLREVRHDLPRGYYSKLPRLAASTLSGLPRIYALALGLIAHTDSSPDETSIHRFVRAYQSVTPLTIGELWAVPTMLRLALLENLRRLAKELVNARKDRDCADEWIRHHLARPAGTTPTPPRRLSDPCVVGLLQALRDQEAAGPLSTWLEEWLARQRMTPADILRREHQRQAANQVSIGNCVTSLRLLSVLDWNQFFEQHSVVEAVLRADPTGIYVRQDFATRDHYRREIERLARGSRIQEDEVARRLLERAAAGTDARTRHLGYGLIDEGRADFEAALHYRPRWRDLPRRLVLKHAHGCWFGGLLLVTGLLLAGVVGLAAPGNLSLVLLVLAVAVLPLSDVAVSLVQYLLTRFLPPRVLPKLDFRDGVPEEFTTFVVMPSLLTRPDSAAHLLERLELHYLANPDPHLRFALLTDFADADAEHRPEDDLLIRNALEGVRALNRRYSPEGPERFFLFHRKRQWNASENCWMGWERKRGKLHEFNHLLRGERATSYVVCSAPVERLPTARFILTLDADTQLPREAAQRLIGTLAHPLNQPVFDARQRRVVAGYGVLQPRVSFLFRTGLRSWFARIFAGSAGIDPYSAAISDTYQDLFGAGTFTGKGLYDVDAFTAATGPAFPDNHILSHDLIEGNFARCGLVSDVELFDDFPAKYLAFARREHRWIRGDWQLLPWLGRTVPAQGNPPRVPNPLPLLERWKVVDNLRRSLVPPLLVVLLILGWTVLPGSPWLWTGVAALVLGLPLVLQVYGGMLDLLHGHKPILIFQGLRTGLPPTVGQILLTASFLLDQARTALQAIGITLYRLFGTRRHLLEWETAAATEQRLGNGLQQVFVHMWPASLVGLGVLVLVVLRNPSALPAALPFLLLWAMSPVLAWFVSKPRVIVEAVLTDDDRRALRRVARKTWSFFERFVGPEDHWLPPDNYQEDPKGELAHRTSPTNKGLLFVSTLAAHDLGYLSLPTLTRRIEATMETLWRLERHHGHFLNWYDTRTLQVLQPAYISTVDSGNLLGCLLVLKQGLLEKKREVIPAPTVLTGLTDTLNHVEEGLQVQGPVGTGLLSRVWPQVLELLQEMRLQLAERGPLDLMTWEDRLLHLEKQASALIRLLGERKADDELARWSARLAEEIQARKEELATVAPWTPILREAINQKPSGTDNGLQTERWQAFCRKLAAPIAVEGWSARRDAWLEELAAWQKTWPSEESTNTPIVLAESLRAAQTDMLAHRLDTLGTQADKLAAEMDFRFLYNSSRNLFAIGYNLPLGRLDNAHYDLLASEACLASFLTMARGEVPKKHWFQLGRPATWVAHQSGLLSWGGTMFEYLMPRLLLPNFQGTLLDQMRRAAVARQIEYGRENRVPWGISESAYAALNTANDYQYQSFGVPGLGLKRGLSLDLVIAPYATLLSVMVEPVAARRNLDRLRAMGAEGPYGFYEALDFTPDRLEPDERYKVVRCWMAHHQGMGLIALTNCLLNDIMPRRLQVEPLVRSAELLLQERVPLDAPLVQAEGDLERPQVESPGAFAVSRRLTTPHTPGPRTHLLSNGEYTVMVTNAGAGFSVCRGLAVTRWRADRTRDCFGQFCYVRDLKRQRVWSVGHQPTRAPADQYEVVYSVDKAEFHRVDGRIETLQEIVVSPEKNVEVRRVTIANHHRRRRDVELTSYAEVVLGEQAADLAHPAFGKLFLETEWVPSMAALLCRRRPRSPEQKPIWAVHVLALDGPALGPIQFETDRGRFLGRRRTMSRPAALDVDAVELTGSVGPVLDPIFALRVRLRVDPGSSTTVAFSTAVADSREEALALADEFHSMHAITRAFELAWAHNRVELRHLQLAVEDAHLFQRLAGHLLFPSLGLRAAPEILAANLQGQPGLWRLGISGDMPILLVRISEPADLNLIRRLLTAHTYWRTKGLHVDLVLLNEDPASYFEDLQQQLLALIRASDAHTLIDRPGGVFLRKGSHLSEEDRRLLLASAGVVLVGDQTPLSDQIDVLERRGTLPPRLPSGRQRPKSVLEQPTLPPLELQLNNGFGGFSMDGREYTITADAIPPAPWSNVLANPQFGSLVTDSGGGYTWAGNCQLNRLTLWSNDPVSDPCREVVYLRDESSGEFWSLTPTPAPAASTTVRHGSGYTVFEQTHVHLDQELSLFVAPNDPVKLFRVRLRNTGPRVRRLSATFFVEWVLGTTREQCTLHVVTEVDGESGTLLARSPWSADFGRAVAFVDVDRRPRTITGDATEFLGRNGSVAHPAALRRVELSGRVGPGYDPCAAVQTKFDLQPGEETILTFQLGQAMDRQDALRLAARYRDSQLVERAFAETRAWWDDFLTTIQVQTPNQGLDLLLNRWLLTQVLAARFWGRTGFYQSGGAFGFRDQLQDAMALVHALPGETRAHLLRAAARQFIEGDVQHWWHPPTGRGVRTRFSDDLLWLPFAVEHYVTTTGDQTVLDEIVPFIKAPLLGPNEHEVYGLPTVSEEKASLYEHCVRALEHGWRLGVHGLPLMGIGDWNDGMNRVGVGGKGESVWLGWFQLICLQRFAALALQRHEKERARVWRERAEQLRVALESQAWDGDWYRRAYFDDGTPLGSAQNDECRIDALPQSWAVISGVADPERARRAMAAVDEQLVRPDERLILLFTPPFDQGKLQPGYIKGYVPGIRENGGQYTHAAVWVIQAQALLGHGTRAMELFDLINPIQHTATRTDAERYRVEPYALAGDVYGAPPHVGRGGWTWYTGSAAWMYRVGLETILGFQRRGNRLTIAPSIPATWPGFQLTYRHGTAVYQIHVENPQGVETGVRQVLLDGAVQERQDIELLDDQRTHEVRVILGPRED